MNIDDFQFELLPSLDATDGLVFGIGAPVSTDQDGFHPGATEWANQDTPNPVTGAVVFGRDTMQGPVWGWDLFVDGTEVEDALEHLAAFTSAWRARQIRSTPGAVLPLRYRFADRVRRIYGRPGKIEASPNNLLLSGFTPVTVDFQAVDSYTYADTDTVFTFDVGASELGAGGGGFTFPLTFPYGPQAPTQQDNGAVVGGDAPASPIIRFNGPWTSPGLRTDRWTVSFPDYDLPVGHYIEIDTRPWANTIMLDGTTSLGGALGRRQRLNDVRLEPGSLEFGVLGSSASGTATATLRWADAYDSL